VIAWGGGPSCDDPSDLLILGSVIVIALLIVNGCTHWLLGGVR